MNGDGGRRTAAVGVVVVIALAILAGSILIIGNESRMFSPKQRYQTVFPDVLGLRVGSPVYMAGVQIGGVESIELPTDPRKEGIPVRIAVDRQFAERIRAGTRASLTYLQYLSGDKLVLLSPGDPATPPLPEGGTIPPDTSAGLFEAGASAAENISQITSKLNTILDTIDRGQGLLGKMLKDPEFGEEGLKNINDTFVEAKAVLGQIKEGQGLAGRLIGDREYARSVLDGLRSSIDRFNALLDRVDNNEGAIGAMLQEGGEGEQLIAEMRETARGLRDLVADIRSSKGLLGRMIYDEEFSRSIADDLKKSTASMRSILQKVDRGEGSLGALVNDPSVYQGLQDIVGGVSGSSLGKGFIHHYQKKGANAREKASPGDSDGTPAAPPAK